MKTVVLAAFMLAAAMGSGTAPAHASGRRIHHALEATGADTDARGFARLTLVSAAQGAFVVQVHRLDRDATYAILVGGAHVADLQTNGGGNGSVRFRTRPRSRGDVALGFDPRGAHVVVRSASGEDVLEVDFPDDAGGSAGDVVCCLPDDRGTECEDRTAAQCTAQGGTVVDSATSCLPNPCAGAPPVAQDVVCCLPDDGGAECEDRTQTECLGAGGTVVAATSCAANPCAATPPVNEVVCCLPDDGGAECEDRTATACVAAGGTVSTATSCTPDPCGASTPGGDDHGGDDGGGGHGGSGGGGSGRH